jgi:hypothetical protein
MIQLPLEYQSGTTLLADLNPEYYITNKKHVIAKLTANNAWAKPIQRIAPIDFIELSETKFKELNEPYDQLQEYLQTDVTKHGNHDQSSHGNNRRATFESPAFSDDEYDALTSYSGSATVQINHQLRGFSRTRGIQPAQGAWRLSEEKINKIVKKMDSAIDKSVLSERLTLEREIKEDSLRSGLFSTIKGKTISDKGFLSLRKGKSNLPPLRGFVKMRIVAPAGSKALDLSFINANSMGEVIFPRDTKIKVTQILGQGEDTTVIGEIVG